MKISSSFTAENKRNAASFGNKEVLKNFALETLGKVSRPAGRYISTPEQRFILACSSLMLRPYIDLLTAKKDKKTDAAIKSVSKSIACGVTGVSIRAICNNISKKNVKLYGYENKIQKFISEYFCPDNARELFDKNRALFELRMPQFTATLGTIAAIFIMIFITNKNVDVPLTSDFQDFFTGIIKEKKTWSKSLTDTVVKRKQIITGFFDAKKKKLQKAGKKFIQIIKILKSSDGTKTNKNGGNK